MDSRGPLLVFRLSSLGDVLHTIPAVVALGRAGYAETTWVVEPAYSELVQSVAGVQVIEAPLRSWRAHPFGILREGRTLYRRLRSCGAAAAIDFQGLLKSAVLMRLSGTGVRWSFDRASIRDRAALAFSNRTAAIDTTRHVIDWNLQLASTVAGRSLAAPVLDFSSFTDRSPQLLGAGAGAVFLHPGAGARGKVWPERSFITLARSLAAEGRRVMILWGPQEEAAALRIASTAGVELAPPTGIAEMAALLRRSRLMIGGDSGPLHLAAAMGVPVIGLYGPTPVWRNGPYGQSDRCIVSQTGDMAGILPSVVLERAIAVADAEKR